MKTSDKMTRKEFIFLIAWAIFTCTIISGVTFFKFQDGFEIVDTAAKVLRILSYVLCLFLIMRVIFRNNSFPGAVLTVIVVALSVLMSDNAVMLWNVIFILAAVNIDAEKICFVSVITRICMIAGTLILTKMGILTDYIFSEATRGRHGLGFDWATTGPILFFFLSLLYIYWRRERLRAFELIIIELIHCFFYLQTNTRMTFLLGTLSVVFFFINLFIKKKWKISKIVGKYLCVVPAIVALGAIFLHVFFNEDNAIFVRINDLISGRLRLGYDAFQTYGLSLFGQPIDWVGFDFTESMEGYNYVDCAYMQYLLEYGVIFLALIVGIYTVLIYRGIKHNDFYLVWICIIILVFCITEPWLFNFTFNPIGVFLFAKLKNRSIERDETAHGKRYKNCYSNA